MNEISFKRWLEEGIARALFKGSVGWRAFCVSPPAIPQAPAPSQVIKMRVSAAKADATLREAARLLEENHEKKEQGE